MESDGCYAEGDSLHRLQFKKNLIKQLYLVFKPSMKTPDPSLWHMPLKCAFMQSFDLDLWPQNLSVKHCTSYNWALWFSAVWQNSHIWPHNSTDWQIVKQTDGQKDIWNIAHLSTELYDSMTEILYMITEFEPIDRQTDGQKDMWTDGLL